MGLEKTQAVVIGRRGLGESDRLVTFYSRRFGKIHGVARAARRPRSRFGGALELFTLGELVFFDTGKSDLLRIDHFDIVHPFSRVRDDLDRGGLACAACAREASAALPISAAAVGALDRLRTLSWDEALATPLPGLEPELASVLDAHVSRLIGQPTRTRRFLRELRRLTPGGRP